MREELIPQLKHWHDNDEHQRIVDAVSKIPGYEQDYDLCNLLGRAYNNLDMYDEALAVLLPLCSQGKDDPLWHYRVAYAYYYLDRESVAKPYFVRASELDPDDKDAPMFIQWCDEALERSTAAFTFKERTDAFWSWFTENEEQLSDMVTNSKEYESDDIVEFVSRGTDIISEEIHFNIGGNHELTFAVENRDYLFYLLPWLSARLPVQFRDKWNIYPYMPSTGGKSFGFGMYDTRIDTDDVMVSTSYNDERGCFTIRFYEQSLCALDDDRCYSAFSIILKITVGEGFARIYISGTEKAESQEEDMLPLPQLEQYMRDAVKAAGKEIFTRPDERYSVYKREAEKGPLRYDVISGASSCGNLVIEYYNGEAETANKLAEYGAQAMFLAYPAGDEGISLRHEIEDRLEEEVLGKRGSGNEIGILLGGGAGVENMYIDLLLYDKLEFEMKARKLLAEYNKQFLLCGFRPNGSKLKMTELSGLEEENES